MNVLYVTVGERCSDGIIRTQVNDLLCALGTEHSIIWLALVPLHRVSECLASPPAAPQVRRIVVPVPSRNLWMSPRQARWLAHFYERLVRIVATDGVDVIHARGYPAAELARHYSHVLGAPWVFDPRGLYPDEMMLMAPRRLWKHRQEWADRQGEYWADSAETIAVSKSMVDYFEGAHGKRAAHVIPSHGGASNYIHGDPVGSKARAVYVGSLGSWTLGSDVAELYMNAAHSTDQPLGLTVVTQSPRASVLPSLLAMGIPEPEIEVIAAVSEEVPRILASCAIGLLPRGDTLINRVAWPVKLSEYLMSGLKIAAWESDCSWQTYADSIGALVPIKRGFDLTTRSWSPTDLDARMAISKRSAELVSLQANVNAVNRVWRRAVACPG